MLNLLARNVSRSASTRIGLLLLLVAGLVSLLVGHQFLRRQHSAAAEVVSYQNETIQRNAQAHPDELGLLLYYVPFSLVNQTWPINGLAIGQRDINPSIQRVTIRALEGQQYDTDLLNPNNLLLGNIDFSFVLIYLFPLLIIAFTYNIISEERENGTWQLVAVQSRHLLRLIGYLFLVRLAVVLGLALLLFALAVPLLSIPVDRTFGLFVSTSVLYLLCWFGVCFWVASLRQSSAVNAALLIAIWIGLLIIAPAVVTNIIVDTYPVPEAMATAVKQRQGYHEKWDMDKATTMNRFYAHYPQLRTYPPPATGFDWLWYYAMQQLGDDDAAVQSAEMRQKLRQRDAVSRRMAWFAPSLHTQLQLNDMARSGLGNHLRFLDATGRFHERLRLHFYPKISQNVPVLAERWDAIPVDTFADDVPVSPLEALVPLALFAALFTTLGYVIFRRTLFQV